MTFTCEIRQHGQVKIRFTSRSSVAQVTPAMEGTADHLSAQLRGHGKMESGYYDLVVLNAAGKEVDSTILIC